MEQLKPKRQHPYLFFDRAWVERFGKDLATNSELQRPWEQYLAKADKLLDEKLTEESYADGVDTQHGNYGVPAHQIAHMGLALGLTYQVTGDARYAEKLKQFLLHYSGYQKWYGKSLRKSNPPWQSELNTVLFGFGFAAGYDCIYDYLNEEERTKIRDGLVRLCVLPTLQDWVLAETRIHALDSMGHNWWNVMIPLAGVGVLAVLDEEPQAPDWLRQVVRILPEYFAYKGSVLGNKSPNYDESGAFYESVLYANFGLQEYLSFRLAYQEMFGYADFSDIPILEKAGNFFLQTTYPSDSEPMTVNFGDGYYREGVLKSVKLLLANRWDDPGLRWYMDEWKAGYDAFDFIYYDRIRKGDRRRPDGLGKSVLYPEIGWSVMRDSWERDRTMLAIKSGFTWNHAHADAGTFILFHNGKPLLSDPGNCEYGHPEYIGYYAQSRAHNVVLFDGKGEDRDDLYRGSKEPGQLYHLVDHGDIRYVYADSTGPMSRYFSRNFRHFMWVDGVILTIDDIRAHEPGRIEWLLHYNGEVSKAADNGIQISDGDAQVGVRHLYPDNLTMEESQGFADRDPNKSQTYLTFATPQPVKECKIITAIVPIDSSSGTPPQLKLIEVEGTDQIGVRIERDGMVTDVYLNMRADGRNMHRNSIHTLGGWDTDAYLIALTRPSGASEDDLSAIKRCFIVFGSFLRRDGRPLYSSMSKATVSMIFDQKELSVSIQGQPDIRADIYPAVIPENVSVNGTGVDNSSNTGIVSIRSSSSMPPRRPG